jgi:hypothetical protein
MTPERYVGIIETIEILEDAETSKAMAASRRDFKAGRTHAHEEVWTD